MTTNNPKISKNMFRVALGIGALVALVALAFLFFGPKGLEISKDDATKTFLAPGDFEVPVGAVESIPIGDQPSPIFGVPAVEQWHSSASNSFVHSGPDCAQDSNIRSILSNSESVQVLSEIDYQTPKESEYEVFWRSSHVSQAVYKFKSKSTADELLMEIKKGLLTSGCFDSESNGNVKVDVTLTASSDLNERYGLSFEESVYFSVKRRFWVDGVFERNENYWTSTGLALKDNYLFVTQATNFEFGEAEDRLLEKAFLNFESLLATE